MLIELSGGVMGSTTIIANLDRNVISGEYIRTIAPGEDPAPVDLTLKLTHQYVTPQNTLKEIELHEIEIPADFLKFSTGIPGTMEFQQSAIINIANPRYNENLFIEISEVRDSSPIVTKVSVLDGEDPDYEDTLPEQPYKDPEHETNQPETLPEKNISTPEIIPFVYTLAEDGTALKQASKRIYLDKDEYQDPLFKTQEYNETIARFFIEDSITNFIPNPTFIAGSDTNLPDKYVIESPGLIVTSNLKAGDIEDTNEWSVRITNPNPFSVFDTATIKNIERSTLLPGLNALTASVYYTVNSDFKETPFTEFNIKFNFYSSANTLITTQTKTMSVAPEGRDWNVLHATVQGSEIPLTAIEFDLEIEVPGIATSDPFELKFYLPQVESTPYYTTRTLNDRVQDTYETTKFLDLEPKLYFAVKTAAHIIGPGVRGLVSTTTGLKDGFHFLASSDRLRLKAFDTNGACIFNLGSATFTVAEGSETEYGAYIDGTNIEFFLNGVSLSTHSQVYNLSQTNIKPKMGSLESSNTTINAELLDWKILNKKP